MREIKFRAWDKRRAKFHNSGNLHIEVSPQGTLCWSFGMEMCEPLIGKERDKWVLMQYTGLKDKNGVEIYEGDIIDTFHKKYPKQYPDNFYPNGTPAREVKWIVGQHHNGWNIYAGKNSQYEVIGNVWENPELLKETN